jgi:hypothetical protein
MLDQLFVIAYQGRAFSKAPTSPFGGLETAAPGKARDLRVITKRALPKRLCHARRHFNLQACAQHPFRKKKPA